MNKYLFKFTSGVKILITASNKLEAFTIISREYNRLFESTDFEVVTINIEVDQEGNRIDR